MEHERHWRVDQLHGARRAGGQVGGAVRVLAADRPRGAVGVQHGSQFNSGERGAMRDQLFPGRRPAEVAHQLARQAEGKIEAAEPRPRPSEESLELWKRGELFDVLNAKLPSSEDADRDRYRLGAARSAGEVDAVDPHRAMAS